MRKMVVVACVICFWVFGAVAFGEEGLGNGLMRLHMKIEVGISFAEYRDAVVDLKMMAMDGKATERELAVLRCHTDALELWGLYIERASAAKYGRSAQFTKESCDRFYKTYGGKNIKPRTWNSSGRVFYLIDKDSFDVLLKRIWAFADRYMD